MNIRLSKSKYLNGLQCKKLIWYIYNEPDAIPEPDEATLNSRDSILDIK
jgi:hypothetical protein